MSGLEMALYAVAMLIGFGGSALYSGLETGVYSLNRVRLQVLADQGVRAARVLREETENVTSLLSTLLVGNNIMNNLGVATLGILLEAQGVTGWANVAVNTIIVTPILFVFGETLPKDLFSAYADRLMYRLSGVLRGSRWLYTACGLVPLTVGFGRLITGGPVTPSHPRRRVETLVKEGLGHGILSDEQTAIVGRVLTLSNKTVEGEMTAWEDVLTVSADADGAAMWELADRTGRSRFPVVDDSGAVLGVLNLREVLLLDRADCPSAGDLMKPIERMEGSLPIRKALSRMQARRLPVALVVDGTGETIGLVTVKDLLEPIMGELSSW
ncbi:CNNM domain-containing protein [Mucisphaera sp.]|uniref:CNNM domain-containing protein n=1 Tax=Mucisphaera sp. TaxID=2913024 RepID=UPI003D13903B